MGMQAINISERVTEALLTDSRTADAVIEVTNDRGMVTLAGRVDTGEARQAAEEIARSQKGVFAVINELKVV
jgi:osmotically-inducible protein OsmY